MLKKTIKELKSAENEAEQIVENAKRISNNDSKQKERTKHYKRKVD